MQIRLVGADLLHEGGQMDGWIDMTKLIVAFRNFSSAPKSLRHRSSTRDIRVHAKDRGKGKAFPVQAIKPYGVWDYSSNCS